MRGRSLVPLLFVLALAKGELSAAPRTDSGGSSSTLIEDMDYDSLPDNTGSETVLVTYFYNASMNCKLLLLRALRLK